MLKNIGAQLYTIRDYAKTPGEIREAFRKIRDIGYGAVQVSGLGPIDAEELADISRETGLPIVCTHSPFDRMLNDLDRLMEEHKTYGCDYIGLGSMPTEFRGSEDGVKRFIEIFNGIAEKTHANGFGLGYHNHSFEFKRVGARRIFDMLVEETDPDKVSFTLDTYWVQHGGCDVARKIYDLKGRIQILHLKDMGIDDNGQYITEVLEGNLNFDGIIKAAAETGVKWMLVEQDTCPGNPFDSMRISLENLNRAF